MLAAFTRLVEFVRMTALISYWVRWVSLYSVSCWVRWLAFTQYVMCAGGLYSACVVFVGHAVVTCLIFMLAAFTSLVEDVRTSALISYWVRWVSLYSASCWVHWLAFTQYVMCAGGLCSACAVFVGHAVVFSLF